MRTLALALLLGLSAAAAGCGGDMPPAPEDMMPADGAGGTGGNGGAGGSGGMVTAPQGYGADCSSMACPTGTTPALMCEGFAMQTKKLCTIACTKPASQDNAECPAPSTGYCTPKSYCQFQ